MLGVAEALMEVWDGGAGGDGVVFVGVRLWAWASVCLWRGPPEVP